LNIPAGDDFASWCMAAMAFLGLAHTFRSGEMIRVGLLIDRLPPRTRHGFEIAALLIGLAFIGFFAWNAVAFTYDSYRFNEMAQGVLAVPLWIPQLGYSLGLTILAIAFLDELVHVLAGGAPRYEKPPAASAEEVVERAIQSGV
jgi:TRAP-type C4-dicarboxylate transport system permease small subunit